MKQPNKIYNIWMKFATKNVYVLNPLQYLQSSLIHEIVNGEEEKREEDNIIYASFKSFMTSLSLVVFWRSEGGCRAGFCLWLLR